MEIPAGLLSLINNEAVTEAIFNPKGLKRRRGHKVKIFISLWPLRFIYLTFGTASFDFII
jgi:hypothetical protein